MESKTKSEFSAATIASMVKSQFGSAAQIAKIEPLTAGWFNTAYQIEFADQTPAAVLRIAPDPDQRVLTYEKEMMRKELLIYQTTASMDGLPVPRLLASDTSRTIIGRDYMFTEKYVGTPLNELRESLSDEEIQPIEQQIGHYTARMHAQKGAMFGYFGDGPGSGSHTWRGAFLAFIETLLDDGDSLGVQLPLTYMHLQDLFSMHAAALDTIREPSLVHWDMWAGNIFVLQENGTYKVEGIIDWERAFWGDPEAETAMCCKFYGQSFFDGYGRNLLPGDQAAIRQCMYRLYLWLIMLIEDQVRFEGAEHIPWVREQFDRDLMLLQSF